VIRVSPQQLDPLGGITARLLVFMVAMLSIPIAVVMTVASADQISHPGLELGAIIAMVASGGYFIRATSPFRAPFGRRAFAIVLALACIAIVLDAFAQQGTNTMVRDDWPPIVLALLTVSLGSYRPPWEIIGASLLTALVAALSTLVGAPTFRADAPTPLFAILIALPIIAAGLAAAAASRSQVIDLQRWRDGDHEPRAGHPAIGDRGLDDVALAGLVGHRALLEEDAIPFLALIAEKSRVTRRDGARARALSKDMRALMIIDDEERWVTRLVGGANDPRRLSVAMTPEQRGCLRAIITHVRSSAEFDGDSLRLGFSVDPRNPSRARCTLRVGIHSARRARVQLAPFAAIARGVFFDADSDFSSRGARIVFRFAVSAGSTSFRPRVGSATHGGSRQKSASVEL